MQGEHQNWIVYFPLGLRYVYFKDKIAIVEILLVIVTCCSFEHQLFGAARGCGGGTPLQALSFVGISYAGFCGIIA